MGTEATQAAPRSSRQSGLVAVLPIVTHTPPNPHIAFPRDPPYVDINVSVRAPPLMSIYVRARASTEPPQDTRGSASPKGEARRECAGKAEQSECRAREDYGWRWAGGVNKPNHAPGPPTTPQNIRVSALLIRKRD